jgi:KUP system potassium uptake protein
LITVNSCGLRGHGSLRGAADSPGEAVPRVPGVVAELFRARFARLAPEWALYPTVVLSSAATIIASQAVISGAFSITREAVQLGYLPGLRVFHTSERAIGQIYVPAINTGLLVAVVLLILIFHSSDALGPAYGIAVSGTMTITTALAYVYFRGLVWSRLRARPYLACSSC